MWDIALFIQWCDWVSCASPFHTSLIHRRVKHRISGSHKKQMVTGTLVYVWALHYLVPRTLWCSFRAATPGPLQVCSATNHFSICLDLNVITPLTEVSECLLSEGHLSCSSCIYMYAYTCYLPVWMPVQDLIGPFEEESTTCTWPYQCRGVGRFFVPCVHLLGA